jgi:hypothetical protein
MELETLPRMEHTTTGLPTRALTRITALVLATLLATLAAAGTALAQTYPPDPGEPDPGFPDLDFPVFDILDAACTPEEAAPGDVITCVVPPEVAATALGGYFEVYADDDEFETRAYLDIEVEDGEPQDDGSLVFRITVPDEAQDGDLWTFLVAGDVEFDSCYAIDDEFDIIAGPGVLDLDGIDDDGFTIDGEFFSWDEAFFVCDGDPIAVSEGTIVAADGGTDGGTGGATPTPVASGPGDAPSGELARTGVGSGGLTLLGLLTVLVGAAMVQSPRLAARLRSR